MTNKDTAKLKKDTASAAKPRKKAENDTVLIRKANELVEARYKFDIWETRIFLKMLTMIKSTDTGFREYTIYINDFIRDFDLATNKQVYSLVKDASEKMMRKVIKTKLVTEEDGAVDFMSPLVTGFKGKDELDGSFVKLSFHPDMKPMLLELSRRYLTYDFRNVSSLSSPYYVRIYEILKQYEKIGQRRLGVTELKELLGLGATDYKLYGHFKSDVLLKAQQRLAERTDISFEFKEVKRGRRVEEILFTIHTNRPNRQFDKVVERYAEPAEVIDNQSITHGNADLNALDKQFYSTVGAFWGVSHSEFRKRLVGKKATDVEQAIEVTKEAIRNGVAKNPAGLFLEALSKGLKSKEQTKRDAAEILKQQQAEKEVEKQAQIAAFLNDLEQIEKTYIKALNEMIRQLTQADSTVTDVAIERVKQTQKLLGENVSDKTVEDFRQNEFLRSLVKREIMVGNPSVFQPIHTDFAPKIEILKKQVWAIDPSVKFE